MGKKDFKYEGVGYNGPHLAAMPLDAFKKEVGHHFKEGPNPDARMGDLYDKLVKKYPHAASKSTTFVAPKTDEEAAKPLDQREEPKAPVPDAVTPGVVVPPGATDKK